MNKKRDVKQGAQQLRCPSCGAATDASDSFCRECGRTLASDAKTNGGVSGLKGLRAFGLAVIALAAIYAILQYGGRTSGNQEQPSRPIPIADVGGGAAAAPQPVTPRMTADQLFNDAMTAYEGGDSAGAAMFLPLAITAYEQLAQLDLDGRYHLALLHLAVNQPEAALADAEIMLDEVQNHLLGLTAAARAHDVLGHEDQAAQYFQLFLDAYTPDAAASRPEYIDHGRGLPARRELARAYLQERGLLPDGS
jgi:tetratricopeptide (TPR) repeat protein